MTLAQMKDEIENGDETAVTLPPNIQTQMEQQPQVIIENLKNHLLHQNKTVCHWMKENWQQSQNKLLFNS